TCREPQETSPPRATRSGTARGQSPSCSSQSRAVDLWCRRHHLRALAILVAPAHVTTCGRLPNKRLKLAGGDRSKGIGVLCPGGHELTFNDTARGGRVARSLSAIR